MSNPISHEPPHARRHFLACGSALLAGNLVGGCSPKKPAFAPVQGSTSAERAVNAAKRFAGTTLSIAWQSGFQAQDPLRFSGPLWEKATGIRVNVVEAGIPTDLFRRVMAEHQANTGALDCAMVAPAWMPGLLEAGALERLDEHVEHYMVPSDLDDFLPIYQSLGIWNRHRYALFDDGDTLLLYYRKACSRTRRTSASSRRASAGRWATREASTGNSSSTPPASSPTSSRPSCTASRRSRSGCAGAGSRRCCAATAASSSTRRR